MGDEDPIEGELSPDRALNEKKYSKVDKDFSYHESPEQVATEKPNIKYQKTETITIKSQNVDTTLLSSIIHNLHKVSLSSETYSGEEGIPSRDIVSLFRELIKPGRWAMIQYYFQYGAATVPILKYCLNISKAKAYRLHTLLVECGLVEMKTTITPIGKNKRPTIIWGIPDDTKAQIRDAYQYHLKLKSPIYRKADKIAKKYLDEGRSVKASEKDLVFYLMEIKVPANIRRDIARMIRDIFSREMRVQDGDYLEG